MIYKLHMLANCILLLNTSNSNWIYLSIKSIGHRLLVTIVLLLDYLIGLEFPRWSSFGFDEFQCCSFRVVEKSSSQAILVMLWAVFFVLT